MRIGTLVVLVVCVSSLAMAKPKAVELKEKPERKVTKEMVAAWQALPDAKKEVIAQSTNEAVSMFCAEQYADFAVLARTNQLRKFHTQGNLVRNRSLAVITDIYGSDFIDEFMARNAKGMNRALQLEIKSKQGKATLADFIEKLQIEAKDGYPGLFRFTRAKMNSTVLMDHCIKWARANNVKSVGTAIPQYLAIIEAQNTGVGMKAALEAVGVTCPADWETNIAAAKEIVRKVLAGEQAVPSKQELGFIELYLGVDGVKDFVAKYNAL